MTSGILVEAAGAAQRPPRRASWPRGETSRHPEGGEEGPQSNAPDRQCQVLGGALDRHAAEIRAETEEPATGLPARQLPGEPQDAGGRSPLPEPVTRPLASDTDEHQADADLQPGQSAAPRSAGSMPARSLACTALAQSHRITRSADSVRSRWMASAPIRRADCPVRVAG